MLTILGIAVAIFLVGNALRIARTMRTPEPLRWELYPIPKGPMDRQRHGGSYFEESEWWTKEPERGHAEQIAFMAQEVLFLKSVREGFGELWLWSWLLHWGLYLYVVATSALLLSGFVHSVALRHVFTFAYALGWPAGVIGSLGLLKRRSSDDRLRPYTSRAAKFNLWLLLLLFATCGVAVITHAALPTPSFNPFATSGSLPVTIHLCVLAFFMAYFPFTHMTHAYMKFFTWHGIRWNDLPAIHDRGAEAALTANLQRRITWAAPHIAGERVATWADAVSDVDGRGSGKRV